MWGVKEMSIETPKSSEIKRLTTPLTIKDFKAYDSSGNMLKCCETLSDVRFTIEPKEGILSDDEILQYSPLSKSASKIRLKKGFGDFQDVLLVHESLPWALAFYYVLLICIAVPISYSKIVIGMYMTLILFILPLVYLYFVFNLKRYSKVQNKKREKTSEKIEEVHVETEDHKDDGVESLKHYEKEINNLKVVFDVKEEVVRDLIEKRFEPPQITYDKFMAAIDSCRKLFDSQSDSALSIIRLAADDTPRVQNEIKGKIDAMKTIINQIEDLTNELVINISSSENSDAEVKNLLDDMENLIGSVKDY